MAEIHNLASLSELEPGEQGRCTAFAIVRRFRHGNTRQGRPFIDVQLADNTRVIAGKIWSDAAKAIETIQGLKLGAHVKILFDVEQYQGTTQLNIRGLRPVDSLIHEPGYDKSILEEPGIERVRDVICDTLVIDIETVPSVDLRQLPPTINQAVTKYAERQDSGNVGLVMSLSPFLGQVVSLAVGNGEEDPAQQKVTVFVVPPPDCDLSVLPSWVRPVSEPELLAAFWTLATYAQTVVTFHGRHFDIPFLIGRSLVHKVPVRTDLMSNPFGLRPHLDIGRIISEQNRGLGPSSLDVVCWALGLDSPKESMDGSMVAPMYAKGDIAAIAKYNAGDVRATTAVYRRLCDGWLRFRADFA